jgi:hypothetical protein
MSFDKDGPRGVLHPVSAVVTDTMTFVADDARSLLRLFTPDGRAAATVRLPFIPRRLRLSGSQLVITPLVAGGTPAQLAFRLRGSEPLPLGGAIARYDDVGINTLANMTSIAAFDDRVVVMHEMVVPFGYVLPTRSGSSLVQRFSVPLAAEARSRLSEVPREPLTERNVNQLAVVAFAATADRASGSTFFVTRTGDGKRSPFQKLLVRLDSALNVAAVIPIAVNPHHVLYLPARESILVVDSDSEWFECKVS